MKSVRPWVSLGGGVLIVAVLYWAQAILVPFALAVLLTFVLTPPVTWLQRWIGRVPAVLLAVTLVFAALGLVGWGLSRQMDDLARDLPGYRANIRTKIADVRGASKGGTVEKLQQTLEGIQTDLGTDTPKGTVSRPVVVTSNPATGFSGFAWLGPFVGPLGTAGLVAALVIFMLLERRDLRDRLIGLIGRGQLATTTRAFDEAGSRDDALMLPALCYAERDRLEHRLSLEEEAAVIDTTRELISDAAAIIRRHAEREPAAAPADPSLLGPREPLRVLCYAVNGVADEAALAMLAQLLDGLPIAVEITGTRMQAAELVSFVAERKFSVVCFADLPPSSSSKARYLVRRLRSALPELRIAVGRWAPPALADESPQALQEAGANHVASRLAESRNYLGGLLELPRLQAQETAGAVGLAALSPSVGRESA